MPGMAATMKEWKAGTLHSSSGQTVTNRKQAIAIGLSEERRAGNPVPRKKKRRPSRIAAAMGAANDPGDHEYR